MGSFWCDTGISRYDMVRFGTIRVCFGTIWIRFGTIRVCFDPIRYDSVWYGYVSARYGTVLNDTGMFRYDVVRFGTIRVYFSAMWCSRLWFGSSRHNMPRYGIIRHAQRTMCYGMLRYQTKSKNKSTRIIFNTQLNTTLFRSFWFG